SSFPGFSSRRRRMCSRRTSGGLISCHGGRRRAGWRSRACGAHALALPRTMAEEKFTRCPACKTIYRVTPQQLALRDGQVRCGHCHTVFDGVAALLSLAPRPRRPEPEFDEAALGPPTVTLRSAHALEAAPDPEAADKSDSVEEDAGDEGEDRHDDATAEAAYAARFSWQEKEARKRLPGWVYACAVPILVVLLAGQALFHFRDAIAAHWPTTKPALATLCAATGCRLR